MSLISDQSGTTATHQTLDENYAFVMNIRGLVDFDRAELAPGHVMRRATDAEIDEIHATLEMLSGPGHRHAAHLWRIRWSEDHTQTEDLPRELWRYYVVAYGGFNNQTMNELSLACDLSWAEPEIGPQIRHGRLPGVTHNPGQLFQTFEEAFMDQTRFIDLSKEDIAEINQIWQLVRDHDNSLIDIQNIARQLSQLKALPHLSTMRFLGYFAVLESMLTHPTQQTDPYDSITRQVKKKLTLLNHRFSRQLDYTSFGGAAPETIWGKLYKYRSLIAHGAQPRFEGDLAILDSHVHALTLLRGATKAVARQALHEPELLVDLRDC